MVRQSRQRKLQQWAIIVLAYLGALAVAIAMSAVVSGCSPRVITETVTEIEYRDSIAYKDSLIYVPLPVESQSNVALPKDTSRVETSFAESLAWVDTLGLLHHTIANKRRDWGVTIKYPERTIVSKATTTTHDRIIVEKKVEKALSWWQKFRLWAFPLLAVLCVVAYWKPLAGLLKKALPLIKNILKII